VSGGHEPVLCAETIEHLTPVLERAVIFVDATFGRGGHSVALLAKLGPDARLIAVDRDPQAIAAARSLAVTDARVTVCQGPFSALSSLLSGIGVEKVDGVLLDLGVSSPQLDDPARGFSFQHDGPLDMRMDPGHGASAAEWLNSAGEQEIAGVLKTLGEERFARRIARAIVAARPLGTTRELARVIEAAQPASRERGKHPATRSFQAIRMHVNDELGELAAGLDAAFSHLLPGGRLAVISFHSLEDRLVKQRFRALSSPPSLPRRLPVRAVEHQPPARVIAGPVRAGARELSRNPRARSATLRVLERIS
jgi:16S rRNA (cytosine1402-N4)-methyltransferase